MAPRLSPDFWANVDVRGPDECWPWKHAKAGSGYGHLRHNRRAVLAHRRAYEIAHGAIPEGLQVCHRCDVPGCVNPAHLFLGTAADNMHDRDAKGRNGQSKLTPPDIIELRRRYTEGARFTHLAEEYGMTRATIRKSVTGKAHRHVQSGAEPTPARLQLQSLQRLSRVSPRRHSTISHEITRANGAYAIQVCGWSYEARAWVTRNFDNYAAEPTTDEVTIAILRFKLDR